MYLIFYDIENNSLRNRIAKKLEEAGYHRLQYSVFIGTDNPEHYGFWKQLNDEVLKTKGTDDKVYSLRIKKEHFYKIKIIGNFDHDLKWLAGDKSSLIL